MKTYTMREAAKQIQRSIQTIRIWEDEGLITPDRDDRGWRIFTEDDITIMEEIKRQKMQIKLQGIGGDVSVQ